ncbi:FAD-dependent oxidoreductase [soil metagenome]
MGGIALRIVIIGGGAAGIGTAGAARQTAPDAEVVVFTEYEDVGYSPCGIPYVHSGEIDEFEDLFLQDKQFYRDQDIDIRYETVVTKIDLDRREVRLHSGDAVGFDRLVVATGFEYKAPDVPGNHLHGLHYPKNIRRSAEFDKVLDEAKVAVVTDATPLGVEMAGALAKRGLETHLVDPHPWLLSQVADPDIMEPAEASLEELGVKLHLRTTVEAFVGEERVHAVRTSDGELPTDVVVLCPPKQANNRLAREAGLQAGSTGGLVVDERMATSSPGVFAAGEVIEVPQDGTGIPVQGLTGSHAYSQGKVAGTNAAGGNRTYQPVNVPWGLVVGKWAVGGAGFGEKLATALGIPHVMGVGEGISRARYYPGFKKVRVKLLADPRTHAIIGGQLVGGEGIKERADFLAMAVKKGITVEDFAWMENVYAPPIGALMEPLAICAQGLLADLEKA